ncbi:MAG TPA: methyltransferase [Symbiobacteriaceae bacterium]|nr:methyltransferase [Symbiobacteriaceae bacterium]
MSLYLPERYEGLQEENAGIRTFEGRDLEGPDRIARHIRRGGLAVLRGQWDRLLALSETLRKRGALPTHLRRLMLEAEGDQVPGVQPCHQIPHLAQLLGGHGAGRYFVSLPDLQKALIAMAVPHPIDALGTTLVVHENVLVPRSQPLIVLLRAALQSLAPALPAAPAVLDMGCGSGVCALLAASLFPEASIIATDHLPEAAATTQINVRRFEHQGLISTGAVTVARPGDLYESLGNSTFDLIIFNAPWVAAPARNRMETALNDGGQRTVQRFLAAAAAHLNRGGRVLLGYSDHSGPNAITRLERFIAEAGLKAVQRHTDRIKTHRSRRAWETIIVYDLQPAENG